MLNTDESSSGVPAEPAAEPADSTAAAGQAAFAFGKVRKIAILLAKDNRNAFWYSLAELVHERNKGDLGRELANVKIALKRSQAHSTVKSDRLMAERDAAQLEVLRLQQDVQVLRATLTRALNTLHAARTYRPWRRSVDEVITCGRIAIDGTDRHRPQVGQEDAA
jgi:hypothetical protein